MSAIVIRFDNTLCMYILDSKGDSQVSSHVHPEGHNQDPLMHTPEGFN